MNISNEDNMKLMARHEDNYFDLAIVDPPYGYGDKKTDILNFRQKEQHREWNTAPNDEYFKELFRVSKNQIIWGGNYFSYIWNFGGRCFIYWHKGNPVPNFADGELAWTSFDKNAQQYDYRYYGNLEGNTSANKKFHPTQKPISLYEWLLMNYAKEGDKILDTHLGSGSIAIACHNLGYDLTACELDKEYYEAAMKRIEQHKQQIRMF
jgi:site-specific DNA-methyltransferase (adenine-specific)|tara:strand:- start:565 stop:1188 length:624 start_codon:yes stop_codon:yes gene_type:complete